MPISSLVLLTNQQKTNQVKKELNHFKMITSCESHDERLVLVTETKTQKEDKDLWETIKQIDGVLHVDLIFHNFEDEEGYKNA